MENPGQFRVEINKQVMKGKLKGQEGDTTNNRMELTAVIAAPRAITQLSGLPVLVRTDSDYVRLGITTWLPGWQARGWRKNNGKAPQNRDLWEAFTAETARFPLLTYEYVKAHAGGDRNEWADKIAK